jgi:hypothetical protein
MRTPKLVKPGYFCKWFVFVLRRSCREGIAIVPSVVSMLPFSKDRVVVGELVSILMLR